MNKKNKRNLKIGGIILLVLLVAYFGFLQLSIVPTSPVSLYGKSISPVKGSFEFSGRQASYDTTFLGSVSSGQTLVVGDYVKECLTAVNGSSLARVCPTQRAATVGQYNDVGYTALSNNYQISGNVITITSSTSTPKACGLNSYIKLNLNLSKGNISGVCTDRLISSPGNARNYQCGVDGVKELKQISDYGNLPNVEVTETQRFQVAVDGMTTLYVQSSSDCKGSDTVTATFTYNKETTPQIEPSTAQKGSITTNPTTSTTTNNQNTVLNPTTQTSSGVQERKITTTQIWIIVGFVLVCSILLIFLLKSGRKRK